MSVERYKPMESERAAAAIVKGVKALVALGRDFYEVTDDALDEVILCSACADAPPARGSWMRTSEILDYQVDGFRYGVAAGIALASRPGAKLFSAGINQDDFKGFLDPDGYSVHAGYRIYWFLASSEDDLVKELEALFERLLSEASIKDAVSG